MQMTGERNIGAPRETVWKALLDPDVLRECIPGCSRVEGSREEGFEATATQKVGPVKATFTGTITVTDVEEGRSCTISGEGKGGAAGFAKGGAKVRLEDADGGTHLSYDVDAKVGGKLAQLGSRIIDGFAKKMADDFFERFQRVVEGPDAAETLEAEPEAKRGWLHRLVAR